MNTPAYPLPEVVDQTNRQRWLIQASGAISPRVELTQGMMFVPLDDSAESRFMRSHEMGHVHWSPKRPDAKAMQHKVSPETLAAVEDMRVNTKLESAGVDTSRGGWSKGVCEALAKDILHREELRLILLSMVAVQGSGQAESIFQQMFEINANGRYAIEIARLARKHLWDRDTPKFKDTVRVAKWLDMVLEAGDHGRPIKLGIGGNGDGGGLDAVLKIAKEFSSRRSTKRVPWGKMLVENPTRSCRVQGYLGRKHLGTDEGTNPRYAHRLLIDGRVFRRQRRGRGGAVLIDASGSMQLQPADMQKILTAAPGCVVAVYSGNTRDGVLRVLARDGRQVEVKYVGAPAGGCNVIDGPALQWLSKQQKPRIWVSDGQVTGIHDRMSGINSLECVGISRKHQIVRRNDVGEAVKHLRGLLRR